MNAELRRLMLLKGRQQLPAVLLAAAECSPLSKTGGLADVVGALPRSLKALGSDARVITPYHRCIRERYGDRVEHLADLTVSMGWRRQSAGLELLEVSGLTVYLISCDYYFSGGIYLGGAAEIEQYAFFQRAVLEALPLLPDFTPEILHCSDWHTAMLPFLLKTQYRDRPQGRLKTVLTIHNIAFQGWLGFDSAGDLFGIDSRWFSQDGIAHGDCANFLKAGILYADRVNTVSPSYADEIRTAEFGETLDPVLRGRGGDVSGILNGLDTVSYDPASDPAIAFHYDRSCPEIKADNKAALLAELGLDPDPELPLLAMVTRMTAQKGFDLVVQTLERIVEQGASFVLLGSGDACYENAMRELERRCPGRIRVILGYDEALSRRIYAAADFLLMPSAFEPCGLSQMIAMRYGALPIVHEVGGLRDTVRPYNRFTGEGNGFSFYDYNVGTLLGTVSFALATYRDKAAMSRLIQSAMSEDWSFGPSAAEYEKLYLSVLDAQHCELQHDPADEAYRMPFGAVRCGETVRLRLRCGNFPAENAVLVANGREYPMRLEDSGLSAEYTAPSEPGLVRYYFRITEGISYGSSGLVSGDAAPWCISVYAADFRTPDWAEGAVMYQIFPDRFARGGASFAKGVAYHRGLGRHIEVHEGWDEPVKWAPRPGEEFYSPDDFYGGTLEGIRAALPELAWLGVRCIYLNPVFEADSNHRYNTADYLRIDPMLGTEEEFRALCADAKAFGIRLLLDGVFSHTGDDSVYFNKYGRYPDPGAWQSQHSPYAGWYDFRSFPDDYRCWWNFKSLPEVNESDPGWQEYVVTGPDAVMKRWLRAGADGWRLDVADELPDEIIDRMRSSVKSEDPDALLLGEVWEDATSKISYGVRRRYALGHGLDSVMNYPLRSALLDFALGRRDAAALSEFLTAQRLAYPMPMYRCLMNHLGTHDTARLRTVLGSGCEGDGLTRAQQAVFSLTPEQNERGRALQELCAAVQFSLPGMPCIYYGDEEGMQGFRDPFCRAPFRRDAGELHSFYAGLASARNASLPLSRGDAAFSSFGTDVLYVLRYTDDQAQLIAFNRGETAVTVQPELADFRPLRAADAERIGQLPSLSVPALGHVSIKL